MTPRERIDPYIKVFAGERTSAKGDVFHMSEEFGEFPWHLLNERNAGFGRGGLHYDSRSQMSFQLQDSTPFWKIVNADMSQEVWEIPPPLWDELQRWYQRGQQDMRREFRSLIMED